ncbi:MAG: DUF2269 family protein [Gammaproteobacteria bacterium]
MELTLWLPLLKLAHIGGLILWLGPSGGAWLLLQRAKRRLDPSTPEYQALYRDFLPFFWVEHLGLLMLLGSGVLLVIVYGHPALEWTWLRLKLALVLCVIVPIEVVDIWFGHVRLPRWFSRRESTVVRKEPYDAYEAYERKFVPVSLPILLVAIVLVLWLAVAKPF